MEIVRPRWSSWSFLVYSGVLLLGLALAGWVEYLAGHTGDAGTTLIAALVLALLLALGERFRATGHRVTGGAFAVAAAGAVTGVIVELWRWLGWHTGESLRGLQPAALLLFLISLLAATALVRRHRFPLLVLPIAYLTWAFLVEALSNGGWWTSVVSILVGLGFWIVASTFDAGERRPYAFWLHVAAGLAIGGAAVWWLWGDGLWGTVVIVLGSLAYVLVARGSGRSSWAVLGVVGLLIAVEQLTFRWTDESLLLWRGDGPSRPWLPSLLVMCLGALLVAAGLWVARARPRSNEIHIGT